METKPFDRNPITGSVIRAAVLGGLGILMGVACMFLVPSGTTTGLAIIIIAALIESGLVVRAILNVSCPRCHRPLRRDAASGGYVCSTCSVTWTMPRQS